MWHPRNFFFPCARNKNKRILRVHGKHVPKLSWYFSLPRRHSLSRSRLPTLGSITQHVLFCILSYSPHHDEIWIKFQFLRDHPLVVFFFFSFPFRLKMIYMYIMYVRTYIHKSTITYITLQTKQFKDFFALLLSLVHPFNTIISTNYSATEIAVRVIAYICMLYTPRT